MDNSDKNILSLEKRYLPHTIKLIILIKKWATFPRALILALCE